MKNRTLIGAHSLVLVFFFPLDRASNKWGIVERVFQELQLSSEPSFSWMPLCCLLSALTIGDAAQPCPIPWGLASFAERRVWCWHAERGFCGLCRWVLPLRSCKKSRVGFLELLAEGDVPGVGRAQEEGRC